MALFRKVILRPGVFNARLIDGKRSLFPVTKKYIQDLYLTACEMLNSGHLIPAPCAHSDSKGIRPTPIVMGTEEKNQGWSSDINLGFWNKFELTPRGELAGYVEVPGDVNDANSPAGKVSKTIKETSVWVEPNWEDGVGKTWKNALWHVALINHPVEPRQENFELVSTDTNYSLAMSLSMADEIGSTSQERGSEKDPSKTPGDEGEQETDETLEKDVTVEARVSEVVSLVKEKLGFEMPSDTNCDNFIDRLRTILISFPEQEEPDDLLPLRKPKATKEKPKGSEEEQQASPLAMAEDNPDNLVVIETKASKILEKLLVEFKKNLKTRIAAAVQAGKIGKRYAESILTPQVDALVMSLDDVTDDGSFVKPEVEIRLEMAEALDSLLDRITDKAPEGADKETQPDDMDQKAASKEELEKVYELAGL